MTGELTTMQRVEEAVHRSLQRQRYFEGRRALRGVAPDDVRNAIVAGLQVLVDELGDGNLSPEQWAELGNEHGPHGPWATATPSRAAVAAAALEAIVRLLDGPQAEHAQEAQDVAKRALQRLGGA